MRTILVLLALAAAQASMGAEADKPDFSGVWKLDPKLTRFNKVEPVKSLVMTIDHKEPQLKIACQTETKSGMSKESIDVPIDGQPHEVSIEGQPAEVTAYWDRWTGDHLVWTVKRKTPQGPVEVTRRAKLGRKGKILTTVATIKSASGEQQYYEFYMKE